MEYNGEKIGIFHNNSSNELSVDLSTCSDLNGHTFSAVEDFIGTANAKLEGTVLTVGPHTSVILK